MKGLDLLMNLGKVSKTEHKVKETLGVRPHEIPIKRIKWD